MHDRATYLRCADLIKEVLGKLDDEGSRMELGDVQQCFRVINIGPPEDLKESVIKSLTNVNVEQMTNEHLVDTLGAILQGHRLDENFDEFLDKLETELASRVYELSNYEISLVCRHLTVYNQDCDPNYEIQFLLFLSEAATRVTENEISLTLAEFLSTYSAYLGSGAFTK